MHNSFTSVLLCIKYIIIFNNNIIITITYKMKSTLKVHNPRVIILLICINDVEGKELSFQVCNI